MDLKLLGLIARFLLSLCVLGPAFAESGEEVAAEPSEAEAYQIMLEAEQRDTGWGDSASDMEMIIRRADGRTIVRAVRTQALEGASGEDKSLLVFDEPKDVRGTAFLTHSFPLKSDNQWIYLPSKKQVKPINSKRKTGRFMGSEFTFEDMAAFSIEENSYRYIREQQCGEPAQDCHVIEIRSKDKYSGYERTLAYVDKAELRTWRVEFFSKRTGKHSKTLSASGFTQYLDKYWRPSSMLMNNEVSGAVTEVRWHNQRFRTGVKESEFSKLALSRNK